MARAEAREQVYVEYMRELGIRIHRVNRHQIDEDVRANLRRLLNFHARPLALAASLAEDLRGTFADDLASGCPSLVSIQRKCDSEMDREHARTLLHQMIWARQLRVDLFQPIHINHPLVPEQRDVLEVYSHLFAR